MKPGIKWLLNNFAITKSVKIQKSFANLFNTNNEDALLVLLDLSKYCNFNCSSFNNNDPYLTAFNEGARDVLLHILELSNINPMHLMAIQQEIQNNNENTNY